jgi:hypothetical protein
MVQRAQRGLERHAWPRLQMSLIVSLTGGAGFFASFLMLNAGFDTMWLRYVAAMGIAYLVFLGLLWLWLRTTASDYADVADLSGVQTGPSGEPSCYSGGGGGFDGGGASGDFGSDSLIDVPKGVGESLGAVGDADELAIPLALIVLIGALVAVLVVSCFSVIYSAPVLLAELMVDGVLTVGLYQRLRGIDARHWLDTALRRTLVPFIATTVIVAACGWGMSVYAPNAHSLGEVLRQTR